MFLNVGIVQSYIRLCGKSQQFLVHYLVHEGKRYSRFPPYSLMILDHKPAFEGQRSIQLSYGCLGARYRDPCALTMRKSPQKIMRQMKRIDKGVDFVCGVIHGK